MAAADAEPLLPSAQDPAPAPEKGKPVMVLLVGAPGSGKTTFCNDAISASRRPWLRICQDTIANGRSGTKLQCLNCAEDALKDGMSIFIDRCNLDKEQRADFVKLGGARADLHAVVLDLPAQLCISRSVKRTGHEGNLQGGKAAVVVNRMLQKKELPKLSEGFSRITFCRDEKDVKGVVQTYRELGISDSLPGGNFGNKGGDAKVQVGIMKFLKKVEASENVSCAGSDATRDGSSSKEDFPAEKEEDPCDMELCKEVDTEDDKNEAVVDSCGASISQDAMNTLAFPSISTSDFQFNHEKASDIIVEMVADFIGEARNARLVFVDLSENSKILNLVRAKAALKNLDPNKFFTKAGDITRLYTDCGLRCNAIANAANWRLKPGGGGVNAAIHKAAGEALEKATMELSDTLKPGNSLAVPLPSASPLCLREGVTHVIHVLGPNMNPQRPNCLNGDYVQGCKVLRDAYASLFRNFASLSQTKSSVHDGRQPEGMASGCANPTDQKVKRDRCPEPETNKKCKGIASELDPKNVFEMHSNHQASSDLNDRRNTPCSVSEDAKKRTWGSWAQALHRLAMHPEKNKDVVKEEAVDFVVLDDLYPKAKRHVLVLSRVEGLDCLADAKMENLPLLKKMHSAGLRWVERFLADEASLVFRLGYHSVPSMRQLHLHVISQDFNSGHLKNKKHWNSFNTPFFRDSADVIEEMQERGALEVEANESLLESELRCHRCRSAHPNIPRLKSHIASCRLPFPPVLSRNGRLVSSSS